MSIFISIPTLLDEEIHNTIVSAIETADNPSSIKIGVACISDQDFYDAVLETAKPYSNIVVDRHDFATNEGVGIGRYLARERYDGEDNILQVDAHTVFTQGWDTKIKAIWDDALEETNNEKTVVTAYLPQYEIRDRKRILHGSMARYSVFIDNDSMPDGFLSWTTMPLPELDFNPRSKNRFVPSNKVNANFMFSNINFVENSCLNRDAVFLDEEITHAIGLLAGGYSMVFPNMDLPLYHLNFRFQDGSIPKRHTPFLPPNKITEKLHEYVCRHPKESSIWEHYAGVNIIDCLALYGYIPESYRPVLTR